MSSKHSAPLLFRSISILLYAKSIGICGSVEMPKPVDRWLYASFEMQTKIAEKLCDTLKQCFTFHKKFGNQISLAD